MKKIFFLLALGGFLISAPLHVCASDNEKNDHITSRPCRISVFKPGVRLAMIKLKEADFDEVYEGDEDENARGQEEIRLEVDELTPVFAALRKDGWSIERNPLIAMRSQFDYGKKVGIQEEQARTAERSIWEKHPKKIIATAVVGTAVVFGVAGYYAGSKH